MKLIKKIQIILFAGFLINSFAPAWSGASEDDIKNGEQVITKLVNDIQSILKAGGGEKEFKPILLDSFSTEIISGQVLRGVQKELINTIGRNEAREKIKQFKSEFIPVFTDYMIRKYSKKDFLDKFNGMKLQLGNSYVDGQYVFVNTTFKSDVSSAGDLKVTFQMRKGRVTEISFDQSVGVFAIEQSGVTGNFTNECKSDLQALLKKYEKLS
jgi:hypothetical protein